MTVKDLLKEAGRRVTLVDIVEDNTKTNELIDRIDCDHRWFHKMCYAARTGTRACLRVVGDMQMAFFGYAAYIDPDRTPEYILSGVIGFATFYFLDHFAYDKMQFLDPYKKIRDEKPQDS
ncbi:hypothetical protein ACFL96_05090 [Thermoproteota archaeon]